MLSNFYNLIFLLVFQFLVIGLIYISYQKVLIVRKMNMYQLQFL